MSTSIHTRYDIRETWILTWLERPLQLWLLYSVPKALLIRNYRPLFNILLTAYLFSIKFLYYFITFSFIYRVRVYIYIHTILYGNNSLHMPILHTLIIQMDIVFKFFSPCTYYLKYLFLMANNNQWIIKYHLFCIFMYEYLKRLLPCVRKKRE